MVSSLKGFSRPLVSGENRSPEKGRAFVKAQSEPPFLSSSPTAQTLCEDSVDFKFTKNERGSAYRKMSFLLGWFMQPVVGVPHSVPSNPTSAHAGWAWGKEAEGSLFYQSCGGSYCPWLTRSPSLGEGRFQSSWCGLQIPHQKTEQHFSLGFLPGVAA